MEGGQHTIIFNNRMKSKSQEKQWSEQQKKLLTDLFPQFAAKKWKMISQKMRQTGYNRTLIECREKWSNFLDPSLKSEEWTADELRRMFDLYEQHGTRWSFIQRHINRQRNIKNKFYETVRNYVRFIGTILCERQTSINSQIKRLPPSFLQKLYTSDDGEYDYLRGEIRKMVYRMGFRIDKGKLLERIRQKQSLYRKFIMQVSKKEFRNPEGIMFVEVIGEAGERRGRRERGREGMAEEDYLARGEREEVGGRAVKMEGEVVGKEKKRRITRRSSKNIKQQIEESVKAVISNEIIKQEDKNDDLEEVQSEKDSQKEQKPLPLSSKLDDEEYYPFMPTYPLYYLNHQPTPDHFNFYLACGLYPKLHGDLKTKTEYCDY